MKESDMSTLDNSVCIIVPIYNGYDSVKNLLQSLNAVYGHSHHSEDVTFLFINDCSPDERIGHILADDIFLKKENVKVMHNPQNKGFLQTVNDGIRKAGPKNIIILNSDTKVYSDIAAEFNTIAKSNPSIGTITPLTNNGTIASLFTFPSGSAMPNALNPEDIVTTLQRLQLPLSYLHAPTGIGFCMFISKALIEKVGVFDLIYGKGYSEECDLCQRGNQAGFQNVITPKTFVYHEGSQSFGNETRIMLADQNHKILTGRFPYYNWEVSNYVKSNPLALHRLLILWSSVLLKTKSPANVFFDCKINENSISQQFEIQITDHKNGKINVRLRYGDIDYTDTLNRSQIRWLLNKILPFSNSPNISKSSKLKKYSGIASQIHSSFNPETIISSGLITIEDRKYLSTAYNKQPKLPPQKRNLRLFLINCLKQNQTVYNTCKKIYHFING